MKFRIGTNPDTGAALILTEVTMNHKTPARKGPPPPPRQAITVNVDVSKFQDIIKQSHDDGRLTGFYDGVKYIVTLAENCLMESEKVPSREALVQDKRIPAWWVATLLGALFTPSEPTYTPEPKRERSRPKSDDELREPEEPVE